jgi:IS30 family transposase
MKPDDPSAHVSHETIYAAIYAQPRGGLALHIAQM